MEKDKLTSISIPAIGTGTLQFPRSEVVKILFEEVTEYMKAHPHSLVKEVRFVAYSGDQATVNAFLGLLMPLHELLQLLQLFIFYSLEVY